MCSNTSHTERGQHSSNLRLHRRMGCLKMPENEEQTFAMVEAMGESINPHISQGFGHKMYHFPARAVDFPAPLHRLLGISFSLPESSRH